MTRKKLIEKGAKDFAKRFEKVMKELDEEEELAPTNPHLHL